MPKNPVRVNILLALALLLLSGCVGLDGTSGSSDTVPQPNTQRTGVYNTKGLRSAPSVAWKFRRGEIKSAPAIADGTIYFGSGDEHLYALDASNGQFRWKFKTGGKVRSSPVVHEGVVYVGSDDGALYAADVRTGAEKWKAKTYGYFILLDEQGTCCEEYLESNLPPPDMSYLKYFVGSGSSGWGISASPVITGGQIYFGADGAYFNAADLATGEIKWVTTTQSGTTSSAAAEGDALYFVSNGGGLFSMDAKSGRENWRLYTLLDFHNSSVIAANETAYVSGYSQTVTGDDDGGTLLSVDTFTGKENWHLRKKGSTTAPIVTGNKVYFTAGERLYALDAQTGAELWEFNTGYDISAAPALADGLVYMTDLGGYLYAIDAATGQVAWKSKMVCAIPGAPAIADGMVYVGCEDGYLYAFR